MCLVRALLLVHILVLSAIAYPSLLVQRNGETVSPRLFESLEELARIVDISYCVGSTGIQKPFKCVSRCKDFEGFELIKTWHTGPLLSDSCGYIVVSHEPFEKRIILAFRGTYSVANTIADLSTIPAEYAPFPSDNNNSMCADSRNKHKTILPQLTKLIAKRTVSEPACSNCFVHSGFLKSWQNTRCIIIPEVEQALNQYPEYKLVLVGHSLGGAVATLAALEFQARGWNPHVTTFGEPRIGNGALNEYINQQFNLNASNPEEARFRRVTHVEDPVPLLPLEEWGYTMHAGEIFISKYSLPPTREDVRHCSGNADPACITDGIIEKEADEARQVVMQQKSDRDIDDDEIIHTDVWGVPKRYKLWQLFFAHRDYFWRLGLCVPSGYPWDWFGHDDENITPIQGENDDGQRNEIVLERLLPDVDEL